MCPNHSIKLQKQLENLHLKLDHVHGRVPYQCRDDVGRFLKATTDPGRLEVRFMRAAVTVTATRNRVGCWVHLRLSPETGPAKGLGAVESPTN